MSFSMKSYLAAVVPELICVLFLVQVLSAYSVEPTTQDKALNFLKEVLMLDMKRYNTTLAMYNSYPIDMGGYVREDVKYALTSAKSTINVIFEFRNNTLVYCHLHGLGSSTLYFQTPPGNILDAAKGLMQRYQAYSGATYLQKMRDMLDAVTELKPITTTLDDVKFRIRNYGPYTCFEWICTVNGIDVERKEVMFTFHNGSFEYFADTWDLYKVGTADLKVSRDEAIRIAREYAYSHPYTFGGVPVNFTILDEPVSAELSMEPREGYTLYPWWNIRLYLDKVYPGNVGSIQVTLWADTGEVTHCEAISVGGSPAPIKPPSEPPAGPTPEGSTGQNNLNFLIIIAALIVLTIAVMAIKKKRK